MEECANMAFTGQPTLFNAPEIAKEVESVLTKMALIFEDTELSYRVVVRFNPVRGFGGGAFLRSFILEYDPFIELADGEMLSLLLHEMVHNWPCMEGPAHEVTQYEATWYNEGSHLPCLVPKHSMLPFADLHIGVADYYSIILLYRLGI
jgi:predicted metalloprotease with PDZ domain